MKAADTKIDSLVETVSQQADLDTYYRFVQSTIKTYDILSIETLKDSYNRQTKQVIYLLLVLAHQEKKQLSYWRAYHHYKEAAELAQSKNWIFENMLTRLELANIYSTLNQEDKALTEALEANKIAVEQEYSDFIYATLDLIGGIHYRIEDFSHTLHFYKEAENYVIKTSEQKFMLSIKNNQGLCYQKLGHYTKAIQAYEQAAHIAQERADMTALFLIYGNLGEAHKHLQNYETADSLLRMDYQGSLREKNYEGALNALNSLTEIFIIQGNYQKAKLLADSVNAMSQKYNIKKPLISNYKNLESIALHNQDYEAAHQYLAAHKLLADSLGATAQRIDKVNKADIAYQIGKEIGRIELLQSRNQRNNILLAMVSVLLLFITMFGILLYKRNKDKEDFNHILSQKNEEIQIQNQELQSQNNRISAQAAILEKHIHKIHRLNTNLEKQVNLRTIELQKTVRKLSETQQELETFMYRASHDLRAPIARLLGFIELIRLQNNEDSQLVHMKTTVNNMDNMLSKLIKIHTLLTSPPQRVPVSLEEIFTTTYQKVKDANLNFDKKNISITYQSQLTSQILCDEDCLELIFYSLLENAVHYSNYDSQINIEIELKEKQIYCRFSSIGELIPEEQRANIFKMFVRASERSQGNGLGLYMARKAARLIEGDLLLAESENTTFVLRIPYQKVPKQPIASGTKVL